MSPGSAPAREPTRTAAEDRWIKVFHPRPRAELRLFCFPYAGGAAAVYRSWHEDLPDTVEVVAVQPPGRESRFREEPFRRIEPLAEAATEALSPHLDRPFAFFGHSLGAILAFEVTRRLRRRGRPGPRHLFVSGRPAPRVEPSDPPIHDLPQGEFIEEVRRYSGTPEEVLQHRELMELIEPLLRADFAVSETYRYTPDPEPLDVPLTAIGGTEDEDVPAEDLAPWRQETLGPFQEHLLPGGHFFLNERRREVVGLVARELQRYL